MNFKNLLFLGLLTAFACASTTTTSPEYLNLNWAQDALWNDGKAEVAKYQAERIVYGKVRTFEYVYVLVKEDFNEEWQVKTDTYDRDDLFPVMKVNKFARLETDVYPYHYLTSIFYKRENPDEVHKLTNTSQEWCGNTAKAFQIKGNRYVFDYMSYWDGQGTRRKIVKSGPWFEDQLSYTLRALYFREGLTFEHTLFPTQVTNKATLPEAVNATFTVTKAEPVSLMEVDSTLASGAWSVSVSRASGESMNFWFAEAYPNYLLKMESSDGQKLTLTQVNRDAYWEHE